jgi:predicted P-loop ATPase
VTRALPSAQELSARGFEMEMKPPIIRPAKTLSNAMLAIREVGFICSYNVFTAKYNVETAKGPTELSDQLVTMIRQQILREYGFDPLKSHIRDAIEGMCLDRQFNPVVDWLDRLEWDGVPRLDGWLTCYLGAANTPLNAAIGRKTLCAMVRRARQPGCKFDHVMVLEGREDIGKSTVVRLLGSGPGAEYFSDATILDVKDKEQQELTRGVWAYEIGELTGIRKADVERVRQFISRQSDKARAAYAHYVVDQHRQCVFIGTTNDQEYLTSQTGNRRFWPVACGDAIDLDGLRTAEAGTPKTPVVSEATFLRVAERALSPKPGRKR